MSRAYSIYEEAERLSLGRLTAERLCLALELVRGCSDPEDFAALDMFLGMVSEHCSEVKLDAAIRAGLSASQALEQGIPNSAVPLWLDWDMARPEGGVPAVKQNSCAAPLSGGGEAKTQATTTHEQPVPEPGPRMFRAALAKGREAIARSDDSLFFQMIGGASLFAVLAFLLFAGEIFR